MSRLLLLLKNKQNRAVLAPWLATHYQVLESADEQALLEMFDLCILDGPMLDQVWSQIQARKVAEEPRFLPFILITSRQDVDLVTRHLWKTADELIHLPIEKMELQARVEMLLRARQLSAALQQRNEDIESFLHALTHDLRAPLRAVRGFAEALREEDVARLSAIGLHYLETIVQASDQMQELVDALLGFARIGREDIRIQPVLLDLVLEGSLIQLQHDIRAKNAQIIQPATAATVQANPILLKMVLTNLLSNALKFVARGVQPYIVLAVQHIHQQYRIEIQDNGIGIALEDQKRLFAPFVQLHGIETYPGVGLGLATVRKAVELMGGRFGVNSIPGAGSTFWIELPSVNEVKHAVSGH